MTNKKVGILTRRAGFNHGSSLQAYAMSQLIKNIGYDCSIIDYDEMSAHIQWHIRPFIEDIEWKVLKRLPLILQKIANKRYSYLCIRNKQYKRFKLFEKTFLRLTTNKYNNKKIHLISSLFDTLICGSDQIWNPLLYDPTYYFKFVNPNMFVNTIAYAPSLGVNDENLISNKTIRLIKQINHLSCREETGAEIISKLTGYKVPVVLDPTLMIHTKEWDNVASHGSFKITENYALCYFLGQTIPHKYISSLKDSLNIKVYNIQMFNRSNLVYADKQITDIGPCEFLQLIKNAKWICTDSYHCSIFSYIFQQPFSVFLRFNNNSQKLNSRIETLAKILKIQKLIITKDTDFDINQKVNYLQVNQTLEEWKQFSIDYLIKSIENR